MGTPFDVTWMPDCIRGISELGRRVDLPLRHRLREVVLEADARLKEAARTWGDPVSDLRGMRVILFARPYVRDGLSVRYAVHVDRPVVFVHRIDAIPGGPFDVS